MPPSTRDLLFEIGCEEIPASFLAGALPELSKRFRSALEAQRLSFEDVSVTGTPRRMTAFVTGLAERQPDLEEEMVGPPAKIAFDESGAPTKAALGFANKNGVDPADLSRKEVEGRKGEYVTCIRRETGRAASDVLAELLPDLTTSLPWPKSMRWAWTQQAFVRPLHWFVALFGDDVIEFEVAGVASGRQSRGHRFLAPEPFDAVADRAAYSAALRERFVIADGAARRTMIEAELSRLQAESGAVVRPDAELLDEVANLVEYPVGVCGKFDESFLDVPEQVIVSAMRSHQRYFAMEDDGALTNRFVTIAGTVTRDPDVVRAGNERVLAARLSDAKFFYAEDNKRTLESWAEKLSDVVFQTKLGTVADKVSRIRANATWLAAAVGVDASAVDRAALLCKADLVTHMVYEFPDLQGVMGRYYAAASGESDDVAEAVEQHYQPRGRGDDLPTSDVGAIVGIADRIDTVVGCFAAGLSPSGSADPYGLRRAALAILSIVLGRGWSVALSDLIGQSAEALGGKIEVDADAQNAVLDFFRGRLRGLFGELPADCVEAAMAAGTDDLPDFAARANAVARLRSRADFEPLAAAFKRVANILKGQQGGANAPDPASFVVDDERALWDSFVDVRDRVSGHLQGGDYNNALTVLTELKEPVDRFFDSVLVMDKDDQVRNNRLALLGSINATFVKIADFRQLAV